MAEYKEILKGSNDMETAICDHLLKLCETNDVLRNDVETAAKKSMNGMMEYIRKNARMKAINQMAMVEDSTVFNWAFDYWHDPAITDPEPAPRKPFNPDAKVHKISNPIPKPEAKPEEAKKPSVERINLFEL